MKSLSLLLPLIVCAAAVLRAEPPARLEPTKGQTVAIVGNTLPDRMQHDATLEAMIYKAFPDLDLKFRNLAFAADELTVKYRTDDFPSQEEWLAKVKAGVVFAYYGFNESFAGYDGIPKFKADLEKFIKDTKAADYSGKGAPQVVLFSPIAQEKLPDPNLPEAATNNTNLENYTEAMAEVAKANDVQFVDLFSASRKLYTDAHQPLTFNGIHLTMDGYEVLAPVMFKALFGADAPAGGPELARIREATRVKNQMWFSRYRTVDTYNIFAARSRIGYEQGKTGEKLTNAQVVNDGEMAVRDVMTENRDRVIWSAAKGGEVKVDDRNLPPVLPVLTNKPGDQPDGSHTYLSGEEGIKHMTVPKGVKVQLFASEEEFPELVNPVQMAWDTKGRLWVSAWKNYPERTPWSTDGDKLLVFEDTDGDGKADKMTTFLDDLNCPTGFQFYKDGVVVMESPDLWWVRDTDGDDRGDWKERVLGGLSAADSHHETNSMCREPGGAIYLSDGVFHRTAVETPYGPARNKDGCIYRWEPRTAKFERYVPYGFANPHGRVFDYWGNDIITDATGNANYFAPAFSGHLDEPGKHPRMQEFWQRPSRPCPGTAILSSSAWPEEFNGNFLNANVISVQGIFRVKVTEDGSGLKGETLENLVTSDDPNFRPSAMSVGPDGGVYFCDWSNAIIGHLQHHLRDPNRDHRHGRIYRMTYQGKTIPPAKIHGQPIPALLELLKSPENNVRERAKIELSTHDTAEVIAAVSAWAKGLDAKSASHRHDLLEALWVHQWHNVVNVDLLKQMLASPEPRARAQAVRVLCYWRDRVPDALALLKTAATDDAPRVRLEAVRAASFFRQWEAADIALLALTKPADYYIDYCLKETMKQLEPWWKPAISEGKPIAANNPEGVNYVLSEVSSADLARLPKSAVVYTAMLTRDDVPDARRMEALSELARINKMPSGKALLGALQPIASRGGKPVEALARMILMQPATELKGLRPELVMLGRNAAAPAALRHSAIAATILADGAIAPSWQEASASPAAQTDWLDSLRLVPDPALRASAYATIKPLIDSPAKPDAVPAATGRFVRIELPRKGTLTLAEVQVFSEGKNVAGSGKAKQSSESNGGDAQRAVDGRTDGAYGSGTQTHTKENEKNPWWELDLGREVPIERISIWNRSENNGQYAARLEGYDLKVFDSQRREVFTAAKNPAPAESATIAMKGDPAGALQRAAIRALVVTAQEPAATFASLVKLINGGQQLETAAQGIRSMPRAVWDKNIAGGAVASLVAWAKTVPANRRTGQSFLETVQVASDLAGLLPPNDATGARRTLRNLGVSVYVIKTVREQMRYDTPRLVVEAGKPFAVIFENVDAMPHNILFVEPGSRQAVAEKVQTMRPDELDSKGRAYVPLADHRVFGASRLVEPGETVTLDLKAPEKEGEYEYVCTFPGHWMLMWGRLIVTRDADAYLAAHPVAEPTGPSAILPAGHENH